MFKTPFSFEGRIRRTEYGLTIIICVFIFFFSLFFSAIGPVGIFLMLLLYIPLLWFALAQGAKRSHDLDNNGWYQIIPLYVFWLLFQDGVSGENGYGLNPKGIGNEESYEAMINEIGKSLKS